MPELIRLVDGKAVLAKDEWQLVSEPDQELAERAGQHLIWPLSHWEKERAAGRVLPAVWLGPEHSAETLSEACAQLQVVALEFPALTDGRPFSSARILREVCRYEGELRAVGSFMLDQMYFMMRCGFDAFALSPKHQGDSQADIESYFKTFSEAYQGAADQVLPIPKQRMRL